MRYPLISVAIAMAVGLGSTAVAQAGPCKGSLSYGFYYARQKGGGYLEYMNAIHNSSAKALTFTLRIWGIHPPASATHATQTHRLEAGKTIDLGIAYTTSQYFGQNLQRKFDVTKTNNFPTLSLTDCNP